MSSNIIIFDRQQVGSTRSMRSTVALLQFREDIRWWAKQDRKTLNRIFNLVEASIADPIKGIGKPEKLKYLPGSRWSRRITQEHRLVYQLSDDKLIFLQCRYHYSP